MSESEALPHWERLTSLQIEHIRGQGFDPFTATLEQARAQPDANEDEFDRTGARAPGAVRRWEQAQEIKSQRPYLEANPIDGVARCVSEGLIAPTWLAIPFLEQYQRVSNGQVGTWDKALGPAKPKGERLSTVALRARYGYALRELFKRPGALPRTPAGRKHAAELLGTTEKVVRELMRTELPPARVKVRANDPFRIARKR